MASLVQVVGVDKVIRRLERIRDAQGRAVERGLLRAGLFLQRESQKVVPVDTGALRNSARTRKEGGGFKTVVYVGYTQTYAIFVHEMVHLRHRTGKIAKYLEVPYRRNRQRIMQIVLDEYRRAYNR